MPIGVRESVVYNACVADFFQVGSMQQTSNWPRRFQKLGLIGLLLLAVNFTYQIYYRFIASPSNQPQKSECDLHKEPCTVTLSDNRKIEFGIQPREIVANKKLTFSVQLKNIKPDHVTLTLSPIGQVQFAKDITMQDFGADNYTAIAQLNQIMPSQTQWLALVRIRVKEQNIAFPFKFYA